MKTRTVTKSVPGGGATIEVRSGAPFTIGVLLWRDESARVLATVVAKATYGIAQGTSEILDPPDPIRHPDELWDDGAADSLRFSSDLAPFKAAHEVLVAGHIYANGTRPAHGATARIVIGDVDKVVAATSPRRFDRHGQIQIGPPQTRFSLRYELAAASIDNPVGIDPTGYAADGGRVLPQLAPPNVDVRPGDAVPLVGLGPVSRSWRLRDALLRQEDREWLLDPLRRPRPRAFDPRYFCAAPVDQRSADAFRPDARLILEGLHPAHQRIVTNLAGVVPVLRSIGASRSLPPFVADTLYIDTDRQIATLAFRAIVPLEDDKLLLEIVAEGHGDGASGESTTELDRSVLNGTTNVLDGDGTAEIDRSIFMRAASTGRASTPDALPFRPSTPAAPPSQPSPTHPPPPPAPRASSPLPAAPMPPPRVSVPPRESFVDIAPPAPLAQPPAQLAQPPAPAPASPAPTSPRDFFRKAFGALPSAPGVVENGAATTGAPKPMMPLAAPASPTPVPDLTSASNGLKTMFDAAASPGSAKAASDAAVASDTRGVAADGRSLAAGASPLDRGASITRRAVVDLLAFDDAVPSRLRRSKTHAPLFVAPPQAPRTHQKIDAPATEHDAEDLARLDVLRVLSCGTPLGPDALHAALDTLLDDPHDFDIPLFLVEGELRPTMDEVETLRVAVEVAKPLAGSNKRVQAAVAFAGDALSRPVSPLPDGATALYRQLEAATHELPLPSRHLADQVERTLLAARSFKKRTLLGAPRIRAELAFGRLSMPIYLPEAVGSQLPLLPAFPLAALVELRPREDAAEPSPTALVAIALGRVLRSRK